MFRTNVKIIETVRQKPTGKLKTKFFLSIIIFPGSRESKGIFANKIINIPITIILKPVINKGVSIFIIDYIIQDEVVNGNVPSFITKE